MPGRESAALFTALSLDPSASLPLYRQLYEGLREAILARKLQSGAQLPSTRMLSTDLGISRSTVVGAYEQLLAEGYIEGKVGAGTYVAGTLPDELLCTQNSRVNTSCPEPANSILSQRGMLLATTSVTAAPSEGLPCAFRSGIPALDLFPVEVWAQIISKCLRRASSELFAYSHPAGYQPLREAITSYLGAVRAIHCCPEQVVIVSGSQQGLDLAARVLLDPGDPAWVEDPGYLGARGALSGAGARLIPVPVDKEGLQVAVGIADCKNARLVCITPSHQNPLGVTMSLSRRLELLKWASDSGAWILEDDYDSEYRYMGRPLAALKGLDTEGRVIYIGTFSKVMFPALRLGYLVLPLSLVDAFVSARALVDRHPPLLEQVALTYFIKEGHFARHIRRMRSLYKERQDALVRAAQSLLAGSLEVSPNASGMHLIGWLPEGTSDCIASQQAFAYGVEVVPLSRYKITADLRHGLMLGYTAINTEQIHQGVQQLAIALAQE
ncbi:PLP-dependent aminotransferase family protein [bacterium]|nr:PLP-dependent aminotransferase family protein [bacterium]